MQQLRRFKQFLIEVWAELKKTTWPTKQEVYGTTLVVIVAVLICSFYLWIVDVLLSRGMNWVLQVLGT